MGTTRRVTKNRRPVESLEGRRLLAIVIAGTSGADDIRISRAAAGSATIQFVVNGTPSQTAPAEGEPASLIVNAGDGADTIRFDGLGDVPVTINGENGDDRVIIGDGAIGADELASTVSVVGGNGVDSITLDDALSTLPATFEVANPVNTYLAVSRNASATVYVDIGTASSAVEQVTLAAGGGADAIQVDGTSALSTLNLLCGDGDDSITLGNDFDTRFLGAVLIDGGASGFDRLIIDDSADAFGDTYTFGGSGTQGTLVKNSGGATLRYARFDDLTLVAGQGGAPVPNNQTFRVNYLPSGLSTSIFGGSGDDTLRVGDGTSIDLGTAILSQINFIGGDDVDRIDYLDTLGNDAASYTVYADRLQVSGVDWLKFQELESLNVRANGADNTMTLYESIDFMNVTLDGGAGNDVFVAGHGDLDADIANSVSVVGGAGYDMLFLDDVRDDAGNDTYVFNVGVMNRAQRSVLWSTGSSTDALEFLQLNASPNNDLVTVNGMSALTMLRLQMLDGDDTINVVRTTDGASPTPNRLLVSTGAGNDTVNVNSDNSGADAFVEFVEGNEELASLEIQSGGRAFITPAAYGGTRVLNVRLRLNVKGSLDLNDQTLIVGAAAASFATVNALTANGYSGGYWYRPEGPSIMSTVAASTATADALATVSADAIGLPIYDDAATVATDTIVRYTIAGDADLDRDVDFADLLVLARNYNSAVGTWVQGNFDYSVVSETTPSTVSFADLLTLAKNYGKTISVPPAAAAVASTQATTSPTRKRV